MGAFDQRETANGGEVPRGWRREAVPMLGARSRVGGPHFHLGRGSHIRAVDLPGGGQALMVANEVNDVRLYTGLFSDVPKITPLLLVGRPGPNDTYPLGYSGHPTPKYQYAAVRPSGRPGAWSLVVGSLTGAARLLCYERASGDGGELLFSWPQPLLPVHGVPEFVNLQRNGRYSLLLGQADGTLLLFPAGADPAPLAFAEPVPLSPATRGPFAGADAHRVTGIPAPFAFPGPAMPCAVDWHGRGRSDLLMGTGDGHVLLLRDIGSNDQVAYDRGRRLAGDDGLVRVKGPACPTVLETEQGRCLLVLDGDGVLWSWPLELRDSLVTADLATACGVGTAEAGWGVRFVGGRSVLCAGRLAAEQGQAGASPKRGSHAAATAAGIAETSGPAPVEFDPPAPELKFKAPASGLCEIHVTLHSPAGHGFRPVLMVRREGEPYAQAIVPGESLRAFDEDVHVDTVDCTGTHVCLSQMAGAVECSGGLPVCVREIRFIPVTPGQADVTAVLPATLAGISDTADWFRQYRLDTAEEMNAFVAMQAACGFDRLYYKLGGASWEYPSEVPGTEGVVPDLPGYPRPITAAERVRCLRLIDSAQRVNRVTLAVAACQRNGMAVFGQIRVQNQAEHAMHGFPVDRFFLDHSEFMDKDVWGHVRWNHCLAWPEVVAFHAAIVEEAMRFGLDGILLDTLRALPKVLYGEPVVAEFKQRHGGLDMRVLPPFDDRVVGLQCEVFGRFVRAMRDAVRRVNPRGELHLRVGRAYPLMGVDPAGLARAGLVDEVIIEDRSDTPRDPDIRGLVAALAGTGCRCGAVFCRMNQWGTESMPLDPWLVERKAREYVEAGATSVTVYESNEVPLYPELRRAFRRLKHPETPLSRVL